jgi:hypothetical protein
MRSKSLSTAFLVFALASAGWAAEPDRSDAVHGLLAVDCAGSYVRIATGGDAPRVVARGALWDGPGAGVLRPSATGRFDGCLVADAVGDPRGRYVYVAVARDPFVGRDGTRGYRVAALRLPDLALGSFVDLDGVADGPVSLVLAPAGGELLVSYAMGPASEVSAGPRFLRLPAPDLGSAALLATKRRATPEAAPVHNALSTAARWVGEGRIVDGQRVLDDRGEILLTVDPYTAFGAWASGAFPDLVRKGAGGRPYLPIAFADAAAERMVFVVDPDWGASGAPEPGGLVVFDLASGKTVAIPTASRAAAFDPSSRATPTVHLTPDGQRVVVEDHERRRGSATEPEGRFRTGTLRIYDAISGRLVNTVSLGRPPGVSARVLGFSGDGKILVYGDRETLYVVDLAAGDVLAKLDPGKGFDPYWVVGFVPYGS